MTISNVTAAYQANAIQQSSNQQTHRPASTLGASPKDSVELSAAAVSGSSGVDGDGGGH